MSDLMSNKLYCHLGWGDVMGKWGVINGPHFLPIRLSAGAGAGAEVRGNTKPGLLPIKLSASFSCSWEVQSNTLRVSRVLP